MRIGAVQLSSPVLVAPMAGVADRPYRDLCREHGAGLAAGEMVSANPALWATRKSRQRLDHDGEATPVAVQIVGADPAQLAAAARACADGGAQIVDINMGCPARKVCRAAAGSALLRDEALVGRILRAVVAAVDVPVTLKIRTGWDLAHRNGVAVARIAEDSGIAALVVHGRTRACGFGGEAEHQTTRGPASAWPRRGGFGCATRCWSISTGFTNTTVRYGASRSRASISSGMHATSAARGSFSGVSTAPRRHDYNDRSRPTGSTPRW